MGALRPANGTWGVIDMKRMSVIVAMCLVILLCLACSPVLANESGVMKGVPAKFASGPHDPQEIQPLTTIGPCSTDDCFSGYSNSTMSPLDGSGYGGIYVTSIPTGSSVYALLTTYEWEYLGTTPYLLYPLDGGYYYYIKVSKSGYGDQIWEVYVNAGDPTLLNVQLVITPTVTSITPATAPNTGTVSITDITGTGFVLGAIPKLTKTGQTDIAATTYTFVSATKMYCTIDLTGRTAGQWNVVVTNPDTQKGTLANGFTVISGPIAPVASLTGTPTSGTAPLTVTFTDSSTNSPTSWSWNFGDGSTSTSQNPSHAYSTAGTYTVSLTATNAGGSNTLTRTNYITVSSAVIVPVASLTGTPTSGTAPLTVTFTDSSTNTPTSWSWNFGDGSTSTSQNPSHAYSTAGTYTVSLTATNAGGSNTLTRTSYISVSSSGSEIYVFVTKWGTSGSGDAQFKGPYGVEVDSSGNVYVSDAGNNRIQKFSSTGTFVSKWGTYGSLDGQFNMPMGVAVDSSGNVYVSDAGNNRTQKFSSTGTFASKWGTYGSLDGQFYNPMGVAVDSSGNVYIADTQNNRIQKFSSTGTFVSKWGTHGSLDGQFLEIGGVAVDSSGNVYVADSENNRIQKFSSTGTFVSKWGTYGSLDGQFNIPEGVAVDSSDNVYVADTENYRIQKFSSTGTFASKWGTYGSLDGQFNYPTDVTVDSSGNVYVADMRNYRTQKFAPYSANPPVAAFTGTPTSGTAPLTVTFTDSSTNTPTSWSWNFGDGSTSTTKNPSHSYSSAGTYTVALTATNSAGSNTLTRTNYITVSSGAIAPVAAFTGTPTSGTAPLTVTFTDSSTNTPTSWSWNFGDGSTSTTKNPSHSYSSAGTYTVALTATNSAGSNTLTRTNYITVSSSGGGPVANFVGTPTSGTKPLTVTFTDLSTNMATYSSTQNQQESGSGLITKTIPAQGTSASQNSVPEKVVPIAGATGDELHAAPTNPEFISYMKEKQYDSQVQGGTQSLGLVPSPIYRPEVRDVQMFGSNSGDRSTSYPSTFDLRTSGKVSPVKNEGNFGTSWAFAPFASLESTLMPATPTPDFSEKNLVNLAGFDVAIPDGGGSLGMATAYLVRWNGPVNEATDPYPTSTWTSSSSYPPVKHVQNVVYFPGRTDRTDTGNIKDALTQWGAVYSQLYWSDSFYNTAHTSYYQPVSDSGYSGWIGMTIIGWDDTYAAANFNTAPAGPGAWIVKNSAGTAWGNAGYFYVSYYDKFFGSAISPEGYQKCTSVFLGESTSNYDTLYSYDKLGEVNDYAYGTYKTGSFANVFTASSSETVKAVGFYTTDVNVPYTINIYKNPTSGPVGGTPAATFSGTLPNMGYNTVVIPSSQQVPVTAGDKFSVVVQVANPTYNWYIPIEYNVPGYTSGITSQSGQGYVLISGIWTDLKTQLDNSHVCVKAYTGSTTPSQKSWSWNFGDGSTSTSQNPSHTYTSAGTYTVALTATNSAGSNTLTRTNYITVNAVSDVDNVGVFRDGVFYLNGYGYRVYGLPTDTPIIGNWDGTGDNVGVWRNSLTTGSSVFYRNGADAIVYGIATDTPIVGDWNGDGKSEVGVWRSSATAFYLRNTDGTTTTVMYGRTTDIPVIGDWNGDLISEVGVFRDGVFDLKGAGYTVYGAAGDEPIIGDWDGDLISEVGVWSNSAGSVFYRNGATTIVYGLPTDTPIIGKWT